MLANTIVTAIEQRLEIEFFYDRRYRVVRPATLETSRTGNPTLSAFQVAGGSNSDLGDGLPWPYFTLTKMSRVLLSNRRFTDFSEEYRRADPRMRTIVAQL
ncbi:MAG: hypothetical protein QM809_12505 [Gordonia sp. (in: high G+C Gram-positive bacteria)]|uniref:hypothetical protein n=1 Tax=Gordonia sp. (in: high G+C Gram-positive bacteria) TaxID=84139 RepID=UPI0039E285BD